jgi:rubrerythrin
VDILNSALTLERLEATFYRQVLARFTEEEFENANVFEGLGDCLRTNAYENFRRISEHEDTHVETLVSVIRDAGGKPVPPSEYNFGITDVAGALRTAKLLENTGVRAYDGAIAHIYAAVYLTVGATIATVEARHASYLNLLNRTPPFPTAFDKPVAPRRICETVRGAFITSSPRPYGPYKSLEALCSVCQVCLHPDTNASTRSGHSGAGLRSPAPECPSVNARQSVPTRVRDRPVAGFRVIGAFECCCRVPLGV